MCLWCSNVLPIFHALKETSEARNETYFCRSRSWPRSDRNPLTSRTTHSDSQHSVHIHILSVHIIISTTCLNIECSFKNWIIHSTIIALWSLLSCELLEFSLFCVVWKIVRDSDLGTVSWEFTEGSRPSSWLNFSSRLAIAVCGYPDINLHHVFSSGMPDL